MEGLAYQTSMITNIFANLIYLAIIYFLWKAIYASSPTDVVNGMTFYDTMIYLVLASAMFNFMDEFVIWNIGDDYQSGRIGLGCQHYERGSCGTAFRSNHSTGVFPIHAAKCG